MSDLRFRAWDSDAGYGISHTEKKMYFWYNYEELSTFFSQHDTSGIIMQSTGCTDINGTLIYEGDIVSRTIIKYNHEDPDDMDGEKHQDLSFIRYHKNGFWVDSEFFGHEGEGLWDWSELTVIGNIHEHPYLLNISNE